MKILVVSILFLSLLVVYALWSGLFTKVHVETMMRGPFNLVYENQDGSYSGLRARSRELAARLEKEYGIRPIARVIGYHVDPRITPKKELRAFFGGIVSPDDSDFLVRKNAPFNVKLWPKHMYKRVTFPLSAALSVWIGEIKAYPAIDDYNRTRGAYCGTVMEIYDENNRMIEYLQPVESNGEFSKILSGVVKKQAGR